MTPTPTDEQAAAIAAAGGDSSINVGAYAGTGKTSTLVMMAPQFKVPVLFLAFNRKIVKDAEDKFPGHFAIKSFNGLGHGAWARALPGISSLKLDDRKLGKLVTQVARDRQVELSSEQWDGLRRFASQAMMEGIVPGPSGPEGLMPDTRASWDQAAAKAGLDSDDTEFMYEMAREVVIADIALARLGTISFDDQIYCSSLLGGRFPQYPVVFVDEAQDLSPLQHRMLSLCTRADGRLVVVGDERQAIYAFRGASGRSMELIRGLRDDWLDMPLRTTFRCPKAIVARQQRHAPGYTAWHANAEGVVRRFPANTRQDASGAGLYNTEIDPAWTIGDLMAARPAETASVAVLCRNNAPLLGLAFKLIRQGIGCHMLGRDTGKGLAGLVRKLAPDELTPIDIVRGRVEDWMIAETSKAVANGLSPDAANDKGECVLAVIDSAEPRDASQLLAAIAKLFERESGLVTLSSIHRAKGLEWDCVLHLDPWRIPSKMAKAEGGVALQQEFNLRYVCETRTKHTLINANLEDFT